MTIVAISDLAVTIRPHFWSRVRPLLRRVDLEVQRGEIFGFLGPNGAGKTTTLKALLGLLQPARGRVTLFGAPPSDVSVRRRLGYMPERAYFPGQLSARELLRLHARLSGLSMSETQRRTDEVLARVGLSAARDQRLHTFSKGMLQRVGLAQALVAEPELVILDEPMSDLDPLGRRDVREIMLALKRQGGTVLFSTHILPDVEAICDRVGIIVAGQTRTAGRLADLLRSSVERVEVCSAPCDAGVRAEAHALAEISEQGDGELRFLAHDLEAANRLVDLLRAHRVQVHSLQVLRGSLEELFVHAAAQSVEPGETP